MHDGLEGGAMVATLAVAMATWTGYRLNLFAFRMGNTPKRREERGGRRGLVNNSFDFHFRVLSRHHQQQQQQRQRQGQQYCWQQQTWRKNH